LAYTALRRSKNSVSCHDFVGKSVLKISIPFSDGEHKETYGVFHTLTKTLLASTLDESDGKVGANMYRLIFELLLRARQCCASVQLVPKDRIAFAAAAVAQLKNEEGSIRRLTSSGSDDLVDPLHVVSEEELSHEGGGPSNEVSPKIDCLLQLIKGMTPDEKGIIFSQWTGYLSLIEAALLNAGHKTCRIDGSLDSKSCTDAMVTLDENDSVRFILCSLKAAGTGINLTCANVVFMMDPWWNDAIETQAIDRCHRVGQTRSVRVYRLMMKDTIEERLLDVQKAKAALGKGSLQKLNIQEEKMAKITTLKDLFAIKSGNDSDDYWL
jgi:SNF2 family DNA or RNA helicase